MADEWKSLRHGSPKWSQRDVAETAQRLIEALPDETRTLINTGHFKGKMVHIENISNISNQDLETNEPLLAVFLESDPFKVPSGYPWPL